MSAPGGELLAAPARLVRDMDAQRAHLPRVLASADDLLAFHSMPAHAHRPAMDARLGALRARLSASPQWCRWLRDAALSPWDLGGLDDLPAFPMVGRAEVGALWPDLVALDPVGPEAAGVVAVRSSGSTGEPISVPKDAYDAIHMWAALRFWCDALRVELPPRPRVALLCVLPGGLEYEADLPLLDDGRLVRISTARPRPLERLMAFAPHVLFTDPGGLHWLGGQGRVPASRILLTSAQHLPEEQFRRWSSVCPVVDYYATSEVGPIAWRCPSRPEALHVMHPDVWVESVGGELVVTRLRDSVLPLLRYRTGDRGEVDVGGCACGAGGAVIRGFVGRRCCWFALPAGGAVDAWQLAWLFKGHALADFRLTQTGASAFRLEVVGAEVPAVAELTGRLERALTVLGWASPEVQAAVVGSLPARGSKPEPFRVDRGSWA